MQATLNTPDSRLPHLWSRKNALFILGLWTIGFVLSNVLQPIVLYVQAGAIAEILAGNTNFRESLELNPTFMVQAISTISYGIVMIGSVALVNARGPKHSLHEFGLRGMKAHWWGIAAILGVILVGVRLGISYGLFALFPALEAGAEALDAVLAMPDPTRLELVLNIIFLSLFAPLYEEVFFRGFLHNWLRNRASMWVAIIISSLAFGLIHFVPAQIITAFVLGIALAWVYEKSGSLWAPIGLHVVNNGVIALLIYGPTLFGSTV